MVFLGNITENEEIGLKEVKNSFFCVWFFFFWNLVDCKFILKLNMDHRINSSMNQWKCKNEHNNCFSKLEKLWKSAKKRDFWFLKSPVYESIP